VLTVCHFEKLKSKIDEITGNLDLRTTNDYIGFALHGRLFCLVFVQKQGLKIALPLKGDTESDRFGGCPPDERWGTSKDYLGRRNR
jgi:predicted transport protein